MLVIGRCVRAGRVLGNKAHLIVDVEVLGERITALRGGTIVFDSHVVDCCDISRRSSVGRVMRVSKLGCRDTHERAFALEIPRDLLEDDNDDDEAKSRIGQVGWSEEKKWSKNKTEKGRFDLGGRNRGALY